MENTFIARQPIYDKHNQLIGYELLYRDGDTDVAVFDDGKMASSNVIMNGFIDIGIDGLVGSSLAFINITKEFILDDSLTPMYEKQTVLEIVEQIEPTSEIVEGVKRLKNKGYKIALDDFQYSPDYDALIELADFVKIDVLELSNDDVIKQLKFLEPFDVKTVAEKVETHEMYDFCTQMGFDYFQGFHFCKPQLVSQRHIPANKMVVLQLFSELENPDLKFADIEKLLAHDATLTFKVLRYVNSAAFAQRKEIESIRDALALVGTNTIKKWVSLFLTAQLSDGKPQTLLITALVRARMCERVMEITGKNSSQMFTVGLLSLLDALMDIPMADLLDELSLSTEIKLALLNHEGEFGQILKNAILYEQGQWSELDKNSIDAPLYLSCYMDAVKWADATIATLSEN